MIPPTNECKPTLYLHANNGNNGNNGNNDLKSKVLAPVWFRNISCCEAHPAWLVKVSQRHLAPLGTSARSQVDVAPNVAAFLDRGSRQAPFHDFVGLSSHNLR